MEYNSSWPKIFEEEKQKLKSFLGEGLVNIFHIGSTSVINLKAKPIIDMLLVVEDINFLDGFEDDFVGLGYEVMGEFGMDGRRYYRKGGENRTHQIHAFQYDNLEDIVRHLAFRDYLRTHSDIMEEYGSLKQEGAEKCNDDIEKYCDYKDEFVQKHEKEALKYYFKNRD